MIGKCTLVFALLAVTGLRAQIPSLGFCPDYLPMSDFDMERFLGKWYEAERYFTFTDVVSRCVVTDYAKAPSGRIYVSNEVTNRLTGVRRVINGNLQLVGKGDEGKLVVKYATTPIPMESTLMVLDTDYDNFAVVWSCSGFGPVHAENAWLMTRERLPNGEILQRAYGVLDKFKISRTFFVKTDQEGCAVAASEINAGNGIIATSTIPEATGSDQRDENTRSSGIVKIDEKSQTFADYIANSELNIENEEKAERIIVKKDEVKATPVEDKVEKIKKNVQADAEPAKAETPADEKLEPLVKKQSEIVEIPAEPIKPAEEKVISPNVIENALATEKVKPEPVVETEKVDVITASVVKEDAPKTVAEVVITRAEEKPAGTVQENIVKS